ncbi:MAG: hypothetical protein ACJ8DZ_12465 [Allosphingosinicella sp.]
MLLGAALSLLPLPGLALSAQAQGPAAPAAAAPQAPAVDPVLVNKLLWSTMAALDQANQTGNYSVLRDLGAPSFQAANSTATLGQTFASLRGQAVDLGYTLVVSPTFEFPPAIVQGGLLRIRGVFPLRPTPIGFDLLFQNVAGQWRIVGLAVIPLVARSQQSASTKR